MSQNDKRWFRQQDPDPEVAPKAKRRRFSAAYKKRILKEYDACTEPGEKGALLRREGIYSSYITTWKRQQRSRGLDGLKAKKRGPRTDPKEERISRLEKENERLRERLEQAELIIDVQKKVSQILGLSETENSEKN